MAERVSSMGGACASSPTRARDRYGRLLAYVFRVEDGRMVNESLVRGGYAVPLTIPPNDRYAERFVHAADEARSRHAALWGACQRSSLSGPCRPA